MPLYEYYCEPCNGVFELLRPAREASKPQPCPECDDDAKRIVSKEWAAFIYREGMPRRLPDTGKYWHLGKQVSRPLRSGRDYVRHPELNHAPEFTAPTPEEIERFEIRREQARAQQALEPNVIHPEIEQQERAFAKRLLKSKGTPIQEKYKRELRQKDSAKAREERKRAERGEKKAP
jgi:putative FmdB family regulatory protein